jgi:hypothetical protein
MSNEIIERLRWFRTLQDQYAAFIAEQHVVTNRVMSWATTARLAAIDLDMVRGEGVQHNESKACGSLDPFMTPAWPGVTPSPGSWPVAAAFHWAGASAQPPY